MAPSLSLLLSLMFIPDHPGTKVEKRFSRWDLSLDRNTARESANKLQSPRITGLLRTRTLVAVTLMRFHAVQEVRGCTQS